MTGNSGFVRNKSRAALWMILSCFFFSVMSIGFSFISKNIGPFQVFFLTMLTRYIFLLPPVFIIHGFNRPLSKLASGREFEEGSAHRTAMYIEVHEDSSTEPTRKLPAEVEFLKRFNLKTKYLGTYLIRSIFSIFGFVAYIAALQEIPLNEVTAISYTSPLFAAIFATFILKEKLTLRRSIALLVGFIGAIIVIRPDIKPFNLGVILAIATSILWSLSNIVVKIQANTQEKLGTQLFWSTSIMIIVSCPLAIFEYLYLGKNIIPSGADLVGIIIAGLFILLANLSLFISCRFADMGFIMPFSFSKLIFMAIMSYIILGEIITQHQLIGSGIILAATIYLVKGEK